MNIQQIVIRIGLLFTAFIAPCSIQYIYQPSSTQYAHSISVSNTIVKIGLHHLKQKTFLYYNYAVRSHCLDGKGQHAILYICLQLVNLNSTQVFQHYLPAGLHAGGYGKEQLKMSSLFRL